MWPYIGGELLNLASDSVVFLVLVLVFFLARRTGRERKVRGDRARRDRKGGERRKERDRDSERKREESERGREASIPVPCPPVPECRAGSSTSASLSWKTGIRRHPPLKDYGEEETVKCSK